VGSVRACTAVLHAARSGEKGKGPSVATWWDLVTYIKQVYHVIRVEPDEIRINIGFDADIDEDGRTQMVVIAREVMDGQDWVQIATPFMRADEANLRAVLEVVGNTTVVGAAVIMGDYLVFRHSLPLVNLDINEFVAPLELVSASADMLEDYFGGSDSY
jgi:hypothetical protein